MFDQARLKLTIWYLLILFVINALFSLAFYQTSTRELRRIVNRMQVMQQEWQNRNQNFPPPPPGAPSLEELQASKQRLVNVLIVINGIILLLAGGAAYFLAGKTLQPIKLMVDEQNHFITNSSHELRTPLASLRAEMEGGLLEKHISDKQARKLIKSNLEEVSRLQKLSDNLINLVKLHHPSPVRQVSQVSLEQVIDKAIKQINALAQKKQILITKQIEEVLVPGDFDSLCELLTLLLDNAIKYSHKKTTIMITTEKVAKKVKIIVKDQGVGIADTEIDQIFHRFFRSDTSRSNTQGFGLGLSIARQIVTAHDGTIEVSSLLGQGSTFTIELPLS